MSSRDLILNKIRELNNVKEVPLPIIDDFGITYENKIDKFQDVIKTVGGQGLLSAKEDLDSLIKHLYPDANVIASNVQGVTIGNIDCNDASNPHDLEKIDLAVVKGEFAVAENGAVWLKNIDNKHRVLYFIAQNIVIIVNKKDIVNNMHEAYDKISFEKAGYGVFVSGPSKTADIEQSLVIGAHGPKSGYVIFI
ncbi:hypothetical protein A9Q76_06795 [Arcobacter sp. 31_11_sub10_T18]|nr:hypothetical protein A9Q76_06795 [Arcobacter sp. 31_11_sub10_T18]